MKPLVAGDESADGRLSPPATQLDGTLRVRWGTDKRRVKVSFRNDQGHYFEIHFYKENTQLTLVWGCTSTQCYPYLWRERQIINNYNSITHYSKKQILTKDTLPCSPCSYLHSYPTSAQCKYSFLLLGLLSYYFEVFGSVPCSRAAERQLLRKIEHYSFISFFHLMPAKPEPFQSLMHLLSPLGCILDSFCWHYEKENLLQHNPINYTSNSLFSLNARLVFRDENLLARVLIFLAWAWASSSSLLRKGFSWVSSTLMSSTLTLIILERMYGWRV